MLVSATTCRVCLADGARLSLFAEDDDTKLAAKLMACTAVAVAEEDGFPTSICQECCAALRAAFDFKRKCESSDAKLRSFKAVFKVEDKSDEEYHDEDDDDETFLVPDIKHESSDEDEEEPVRPRRSTRGKCTKTPRRAKARRLVTNNIATSLLEGKFMVKKEDANLGLAQPPIDRLKTEAMDHEKLMVIRKSKSAKKKLTNNSENLCESCGKTFRNKTRLKYHMTMHHEKHETDIKCSDPGCKKRFKMDNYMIRHVKRCHSEKREFICNECGKQYAFISGLKQHMKSHTGTIEWKQCNFCTQKYRTQKSVDIHIRSVHTGERPSVCTICDSAFFHPDYLKEHMRLHTGETPFKCPVCNRGYAQRGNMKSHMKQHRLSEVDERIRSTLKPNYLKLLKTY